MKSAGGGRRTCATLPTFRTRITASLGGGAVPQLVALCLHHGLLC